MYSEFNNISKKLMSKYIVKIDFKKIDIITLGKERVLSVSTILFLFLKHMISSDSVKMCNVVPVSIYNH